MQNSAGQGRAGRAGWRVRCATKRHRNNAKQYRKQPTGLTAAAAVVHWRYGASAICVAAHAVILAPLPLTLAAPETLTFTFTAAIALLVIFLILPRSISWPVARLAVC